VEARTPVAGPHDSIKAILHVSGRDVRQHAPTRTFTLARLHRLSQQLANLAPPSGRGRAVIVDERLCSDARPVRGEAVLDPIDAISHDSPLQDVEWSSVIGYALGKTVAIAAPQTILDLGFRARLHEWHDARALIALDHFTHLHQRYAGFNRIWMRAIE
jgi:hypothetical protein